MIVPGWEEVYLSRTVIIASGTFLQGKIFVGDVSYDGGPDGMFAATRLTGSLRALGVALRRFKTGHPGAGAEIQHRFFPDGAAGRGGPGGALLL